MLEKTRFKCVKNVFACNLPFTFLFSLRIKDVQVFQNILKLLKNAMFHSLQFATHHFILAET